MTRVSRTILIVDDEPMIRRLVRIRLEQSGYEVRDAADGAAAVGIVDEFKPDVVISDILMPDFDGIEVIRSLRKSHPSIRLIAISGAPNDVFLNSAKVLGAARVLRKPFSMDELVAAVEEVLEKP